MLAVLITLGLLSAPVLVPPAGARSSQSTPSAPRASMPDPTPGVIRVTASRIDDQYRRRPFSRMYAIELDHDIRAYRFVRDTSGRMLDAWRPHWEKLAHLADPITHALKEPQNAGPKTEVLVRHYDYPNASTRHPTTISRPSVEPGKHYEVRFEYRQAGGRTVPVRITETGYSHGRRVQRTSLLQYSDEGVLTHIDGPRPGTDDLLRVEMSPQSGDIVQVAREDRPFDLRVYDGLGHEVPVNRISWLYSTLAWYQDTVAPGGYPMAGVVVPQRDDSGIRLEIDDFNRIVRADSPDTGATVYTYDESDRVMEVREADGAHARYEHDAYDRLVRQSLAAQGGPAEVTRYQYFGPWLVGVDAPHVMERYTYDEQYRLEQRDVDIRINGAPRDIHFRTRYHYAGTSRRPVGLTLPGGARLDYSGTPDDVRVGAGNFEVNTRSAWLPGAPAGHATPAGRHGEHDTDPGTDAPMLYRRVTGTRDGQDVQAWHFGNGTGRDATFDRRYGLTLLRDGSNPSRAASDYLRFAMYRRFGQPRQPGLPVRTDQRTGRNHLGPGQRPVRRDPAGRAPADRMAPQGPAGHGPGVARRRPAAALPDAVGRRDHRPEQQPGRRLRSVPGPLSAALAHGTPGREPLPVQLGLPAAGPLRGLTGYRPLTAGQRPNATPVTEHRADTRMQHRNAVPDGTGIGQPAYPAAPSATAAQ